MEEGLEVDWQLFLVLLMSKRINLLSSGFRKAVDQKQSVVIKHHKFSQTPKIMILYPRPLSTVCLTAA